MLCHGQAAVFIEFHRQDLIAGILGNIVDPDLGGEVRHKADGHALPFGPAGTADPVDIVLIFIRNVAVEHDVHIIHVDAPGGHVSGNKDPKLTLAEQIHYLLPLLLGNVPMDALGVDAPHLQELGDALRVALGIT